MGRFTSFARDERGASAVEFALVGSLLIFTILLVLCIGMLLYMNQALDFATYKASRQVMIGAAQKAGATQTTFASSYICPLLPVVLTCQNLTVNLYTVTETAGPTQYYNYVNSNQTALLQPTLGTTTQFSMGTQGSYEYLQVVYPITFMPGLFFSLIGGGVTYNGSQAALIVSTAAFRNEQY